MTEQKNTDHVLLLTARNAEFIGKEYFLKRVRTGFEVDHKQYGHVKRWIGEVVTVRGLDDMHALLVDLEQRPDTCMVRALPADHADLDDMNRRTNESADEDTGDLITPDLVEVDHWWVNVDIDKVPIPAGLDWRDRSTWDHAVRQIIAEHLPAGVFGGRACVYQWSSSAGTRANTVSLHLIFWGDRRACDRSLREWAKRTAPKADPQIYTGAQPYYTTRPMFYAPMRDPFDGASRVGRLDGLPTLTLPFDVVDIETDEELREARRVRQIEKAQERMKAYRERSRSSGLDESDDPGRIRFQAEKLAESALRRMMGADVGERDQVRRDAAWMLGGLQLYLPGRDLLGEAEELTAAMFSGDGNSEMHARVRRTQVNFYQGLDRPMVIDIDHGTETTADESARDHAEEDAVTPPAAPSPIQTDGALASLLDIDGLGALADMVEPLPQPFHVAEARDELEAVIRESLVDSTGVTVIKASAGLGKSRAMYRVVIEMCRRDPELRVMLAVPNHRLANESERALREVSDGLVWVDHATTRTDETCVEFAEYSAALHLDHAVGKRFCASCGLNPRNNDGEGGCLFMSAGGSARGAQVQIVTHALLAQIAPGMDDQQRPDLLIVDEDPWDVTSRSASLGVEEVALLVQSGLLRSDGQVWVGNDVMDATTALMRLMGKSIEVGARYPRRGSEAEQWAWETYRHQESDQLGARVGAALVMAGEDEEEAFVESVWERSRASTTQDERIRILTSAPSQTARQALRGVLDHGWVGGEIKRGQLGVCAQEKLPTIGRRATVVLDATATEGVGRGMFDKDQVVKFITIEVEAPEGVRFIHVDMSATKGDHIGDEGTGSTIARARWGAIMGIHAGAAGERGLVITHKAYLEDPTSTPSVILDGVAPLAERLHHNGVAARGSNDFRDATTVVIDDYRVPRSVVRLHAEAIAAVTGIDLKSEAFKQLLNDVRRQKEMAPMVQAVNRIRPLDASVDNPKTIVIVSSEHCPLSLGLTRRPERVEPFDVDVEMWRQLGWVGPAALIDVTTLGVVRAREVGPTVLSDRSIDPLSWSDLLEGMDLVPWREALARALFTPDDGFASSIYAGPSFRVKILCNREVSSNVWEWVASQVRRQYGGDWTMGGELQKRDIRTLMVQPGGGAVGRPFPLWVSGSEQRDPLELNRVVEAYVRRSGGDRWRLESDDQWRLLPETQEDLDDVFLKMASLKESGLGVTEYLKQLGALMHTSGSSMRRRLEQTRPRGRSMAQWVQDCWYEAQTRAELRLIEAAREAAEERAAIVADDEGRDPREEPVDEYFSGEMATLRQRLVQLAEETGRSACDPNPSAHQIREGWPE